MNRSTTTFLRHALLTAVAPVILFSASACGGSSGNPNTPADVTSTPIASASPRPAATSSPAGSPAVPPLAAASPTGVSGSTPAPRPTQPAPSTPTQLPAPSSVLLTIVASGLRFAPDSLTAPAGALVNVTLDNRDDGLPHNITFYDPAGTRVAETETATGPSVNSTAFTPAAPGSYSFTCTVHTVQMKGTLTIQ